jgi:uncharacterized RDD family membrane protein YckC
MKKMLLILAICVIALFGWKHSALASANFPFAGYLEGVLVFWQSDKHQRLGDSIVKTWVVVLNKFYPGHGAPFPMSSFD